MACEAKDYHLLSPELSYLEYVNVRPAARTRSEQAADREAVRSDAHVAATRQELKRKNHNTEPEECDCEPTQLLPDRAHEDATRHNSGADKQQADHPDPARAEDLCMLGVHRLLSNARGEQPRRANARVQTGYIGNRLDREHG